MQSDIYRTLLLLALLLSVCTDVKAQFLDSIKTSFSHTPRPDLKIDSRNSFITQYYAQIMGVKAGLNFNNTVKLGVGYNWLASRITREKTIINANGESEKVDALLKFAYFSPYMEYTFFRNRKWDISIPVLIGLGWSYYRYHNVLANPIKIDQSFTLLYEPYMTAHYQVIKWVAVGAGVGYRLVLVGNKDLGENFNSPIYVIKIKLLLGEIMDSIKGAD